MKVTPVLFSAKSFTLAEVMIVITVIMILSLILVPNMLRARLTANEAMAIANTRAIHTALQIYYNENNSEYPVSLSDLSGHISPALVSGFKSGYLFIYVRDSEDSFHINVDPRTHHRTGVRYFYLDETGTLRFNAEAQATVDDPIVT